MGAAQRHRPSYRDRAGAATDLRSGHHAPSLDGQPRRRRGRQHGARLQHVERVGAEFSKHCVFRATRERCTEHVAADGDAACRGRGLADEQLRRLALRSLGRLHGDERRSRRRLHVLVHERVLQQSSQRLERQLADAHRRVQVPGMHGGFGANGDDRRSKRQSEEA